MPSKSKHYCKQPGCSVVLESGKPYCPKHQKQHDEYYETKRGTSNDRGYTYKWQLIRKAHLEAQPLCEMCKSNGIIKRAKHVHHIIPLIDGGTHSKENLMSLCINCHSSITSKTTRDNSKYIGDMAL